MAVANRRSFGQLLPVFVIIFVLIGVGTSINRTAGVLNGKLLFDPFRKSLPPETIKDVETIDRAFVAHPVRTLLHIIAGSVFLILAPLQFSATIRNRYLNFHRWSGRIIVVIALITGIFGLLLALPFQFTGFVPSSAVIVFGTLFLFALLKAFIAIRQHDVIAHRKWMIRVFSIAIGIATVRIAAAVLILITARPSFTTLGLSFWIGWTVTFAAGELWIKYHRSVALA